MPNLVLNHSDVFPVGTSVSAYPGNAVKPGHATAFGPSLESQTVVTAGTATFTTLSADTPYVFTAVVNGTSAAVRQQLSSYVKPATWAETIIARKAAIGTA
jgi:hypothetical protein